MSEETPRRQPKLEVRVILGREVSIPYATEMTCVEDVVEMVDMLRHAAFMAFGHRIVCPTKEEIESEEEVPPLLVLKRAG